ncbi:MAG: dienelactone hydrolase family protein [Coriobacteriia bacterium]|nr:dienelactone hydrolase family protein [Coriobacteriia bacterium]
MRTWPKWLKVIGWVVGGLSALALLLVAVLAISVAVDRRGGDERLAEVSNGSIPGLAGPAVPAYVATPEGAGPHPVVIIVHEFWGLNPDIVSKADLLAAGGRPLPCRHHRILLRGTNLTAL